MAKENIAFMVNLRKNTVPDSDMFGRYYPEAESKETLSTKGFAKHVSDHGGTLVSYELMQMVLAGIVKCLKEYMSQGQPVKLDGLGTFRPTVTSVTGGAASIEEALQKGVNNMVAGVNFVFIPENAQGEEITSKKFKDQCSLQFAYLVETIKKVIGGKEKSYTLRTPLSAWGIVQSEDEGTGEEGGTSQNGGTSGSGSSQSGSNTGGSLVVAPTVVLLTQVATAVQAPTLAARRVATPAATAVRKAAPRVTTDWSSTSTAMVRLP